jgi:glutathione S-transferase
MQESKSLVLHGNPRSGNTRKVRWALEELGVGYRMHVLDLARGDQRHPEYLKLNPNGKVPTLVDAGFVLWESDAILWYLAETYGQQSLLPQGENGRALTQQWMSWNAYHLADGTYRARVLRMTALRAGAPLDTDRHAEIVRSAAATLEILDRHIEDRPFVVGESLSIADVALAMNVRFGVEEGVALDRFAHIARWFDAVCSRAAYKTANG